MDFSIIVHAAAPSVYVAFVALVLDGCREVLDDLLLEWDNQWQASRFGDPHIDCPSSSFADLWSIDVDDQRKFIQHFWCLRPP